MSGLRASLIGSLIVALVCVAGGAKAQNEKLAQGEYLVRAGGCVTCHTADAARPFAGGKPIATPFGDVYAPNLTSDRATGIGAWTDAQFIRAMREGVGRNGERLYPAFPYTAYTLLSDDDLLAMRAYLATVPPVRATTPRNTLSFPFDQRWLMPLWNLVNFTPGRFVPDPSKSAEWNRGAYLVEGLGHCGECHTPRNWLGGLKSGARLAGADVAGWRAGNLTADRVAGIGAWRDDELTRFLSTGAAPGRAHALGPMAEVVAASTQYLTPADQRAIVVYLRTVSAVPVQNARVRTSFGQASRVDVTSLDASGDGARLYAAACASCHGMTGEGIVPFPALIHDGVTGALGTMTTSNLVLVILHGVNRKTREAHALMPAFGAQFTDEQIAALGNYLTRQFGDPRAMTDAKSVARLRAISQ
ncbi:cytochrome c, class I [Caballeronia hypogeia]|uniref:Cytochrome c, class I n=1 Tax=Caballeronia hypogeia TaxID=1777140 RepID=A0A158DDB9_9BURK|nr:cytochrome c [Caballeronia hypogeia]SAK92453.1 cytochrome c, class I [Caballeronia hypogeia]